MLFLMLVAVVAALAVYLHEVYSYFSRRGVKTDPIVPFFGSMFSLVLRREHFAERLDRIYNAFPGERFVGSYEFLKPLIIVRDVELLKKIAIKDFECFVNHRPFIDESTDPLLGRNLISLNGDEWKDMRSTLSPAFTSSKIRQMMPFMVEVGDQMLINLKKRLNNSDTPWLELDVMDLTSRYANDVIASCAFGLKVDSHSDRENEFYRQGHIASIFTLKHLVQLFFSAAFPWLMKKLNIKLFPEETNQFFTNLVLQTIQERETHYVYRPDAIQLLMEAKKGTLPREDGSAKEPEADFMIGEEPIARKKEVNRVWKDTDLVAQAHLFFVAGFETIAAISAFLLYELALQPELQDRLAKEIRETDDRNGGKLDYDSIQSMVYLNMAVCEILRLWSPNALIDRLCMKDYNLGKPNNNAKHNYILRKGMGIQFSVWAVHRDPQHFPNPEKFDPDRFSKENKHKIKPFTYLPFGIGPRICIGYRFALCEVKVMIYQLLRHVEVTPGPRTRIPAQPDPDLFIMNIKGGHWLNFRLRE